MCASPNRGISGQNPPLPTRTPGRRTLQSKPTLYTQLERNEGYDMYAVKDPHTQPYMLEVHLNDVPVQMELDTGRGIDHHAPQTTTDVA